MPSRRVFLSFAVGTGLLAVAGCTATEPLGGSKLSTPTPSAPEVTSSSAAAGPLTGGTAVTLSGVNLAGVTGVAVGTAVASSITTDGSGAVTFTTPMAVDYQPVQAPITLTLSDGATITTGATFSYEAQTPVDKQLQYAFQYWQNYNLAEWGRFPDNDCGNFVNQTLLARGWTQNDDWYSDYVATGDYSYSWIRGNEMDAYLDSRDDTTRLTIEQRDQVKIGDVVMFDWDPQNDNGVDHTMLVSAVIPQAGGPNQIKLAGHTVDAQFRDFDEAITVDNPGGTAHFYSIS